MKNFYWIFLLLISMDGYSQNLQEFNTYRKIELKNSDIELKETLEIKTPIKFFTNSKNDSLMGNKVFVKYWPYLSTFFIEYLKGQNLIYNNLSTTLKVAKDSANKIEVPGFKYKYDLAITSLVKLKDKLNKTDSVYKFLAISNVELIDTLKLKIRLDSLANNFKKNDKDLATLLKDASEKTNMAIEDVNNATNLNKRAIQALGVMPKFSSLFGENLKIIPSINIMGSSAFVSENLFAEAKLFVGGNSQASKIQTIDIFYSDISSYGISVSLDWKFFGNKIPNSPIGVYGNFNFLGKNLKKDSLAFFTNALHYNLGSQIVILKNLLSFYLNYNRFTPLTNTKKINDTFKFLEDNQYFFDGGFKLFLNSNKIFNLEGIKLILDLNFLNLKDQYVAAGFSDKWTPSLRFGIDRRL